MVIFAFVVGDILKTGTIKLLKETKYLGVFNKYSISDIRDNCD